MDPTEQPIDEMFVNFENDPGHVFRALEEVRFAQRHTATGDIAARKRTLTLSLDFFALLDQQIDLKWNPKQVPVRRAPPPPPGLDINPAGEVDPEQISDPETRARYRQELQARKDSIKHYNAQFELHRIDEEATDHFKRFVKRCYSGSDPDRREFEELLDASSLSDDRKKSFRKLLRPRLWPFN